MIPITVRTVILNHCKLDNSLCINKSVIEKKKKVSVLISLISDTLLIEQLIIYLTDFWNWAVEKSIRSMPAMNFISH